jgi:hypothetical protein
MALIETCTKEGNSEFPSFFDQQNLHHYKPECVLFQLKHPQCDIDTEQQSGNIIACSTATSCFSRHLVLLMGLKKWIGATPDLDCPVTYKQYGQTYGEQLEIISLTLRDKVMLDSDWYLDADHVLDITKFWNNHSSVIKWLSACGFTPDQDRVIKFCNSISHANQYYYDVVARCFDIVKDVVKGKIYPIELSFYETAICHSLLLQHYGKSHVEVKLLNGAPISTKSFIEVFDV